MWVSRPQLPQWQLKLPAPAVQQEAAGAALAGFPGVVQGQAASSMGPRMVCKPSAARQRLRCMSGSCSIRTLPAAAKFGCAARMLVQLPPHPPRAAWCPPPSPSPFKGGGRGAAVDWPAVSGVFGPPDHLLMPPLAAVRCGCGCVCMGTTVHSTVRVSALMCRSMCPLAPCSSTALSLSRWSAGTHVQPWSGGPSFPGLQGVWRWHGHAVCRIAANRLVWLGTQSQLCVCTAVMVGRHICRHLLPKAHSNGSELATVMLRHLYSCQLSAGGTACTGAQGS
jgi:hypothetical protein